MDTPERLANAGVSAAELALGRYGLLPVPVAAERGVPPGPLAVLLWRDLDATKPAAPVALASAPGMDGRHSLLTSGVASGRSTGNISRIDSRWQAAASGGSSDVELGGPGHVPQPLRSSTFQITESLLTGGGGLAYPSLI